MRIGSAIALIVIGAIMSFAVTDAIQGVDLTLIGYILMAAGAIGLVISLVLNSRSKSLQSERRVVRDPNTGDEVVQTRTDGL